jgi:hypothetical protein
LTWWTEAHGSFPTIISWLTEGEGQITSIPTFPSRYLNQVRILHNGGREIVDLITFAFTRYIRHALGWRAIEISAPQLTKFLVWSGRRREVVRVRTGGWALISVQTVGSFIGVSGAVQIAGVEGGMDKKVVGEEEEVEEEKG